jgi:hypothetical protein
MGSRTGGREAIAKAFVWLPPKTSVTLLTIAQRFSVGLRISAPFPIESRIGTKEIVERRKRGFFRPCRDSALWDSGIPSAKALGYFQKK